MLQSVLKGVETTSIIGNESISIHKIELDSRRVEKGDLFLAVRGTTADGHQFIQSAIGNGASVIVCENVPAHLSENVTYVTVPDSSAAAGMIASNFYDRPSEKMKVIGITGTNGKTTTATLLFDLVRLSGYKAGLISTVAYKIEDHTVEADRTTPDAINLHRIMAQMADAGCEFCFMEVSSHSTVQHRINGIRFTGGLFTNITLDHLDYHGSFAEYIKAKKLFFDNYLLKGAFAVVNSDDRNGRVMVQNTKATVRTFSVKNFSDYRVRIIEPHFDGTLMDIDHSQVWVRLIGEFNAYNLAGVYAVARELGFAKEEILPLISQLSPVAGRFEYLRSLTGITAIIDYAHTPDALENVLQTISQLRQKDQRILTVVGCGGDRDKSKRPLMAQIAVDYSDFSIFTSDNPRTENPLQILADMAAGVPADLSAKFVTIENRREAIKMAYVMATTGSKSASKPETGDIILIAGKGHETYQVIGQTQHHFDDKEEIQKLFGN